MKMCRRAGGVWLAAGLAAISLARAELQTPPAQKTPAAGMDALLTGRDLLNQGRWMDAVRFYRMALKTTPESSEVRFGLATALTQIERYAEAVPLLESLLREYPDNPAVLNNLAWILAKAEDAVLRDQPRDVILLDQIVQVVVGLQNHAAAAAAVAAARPALGHERLAMKRHGTFAAVTGLGVNFDFVDEHGVIRDGAYRIAWVDSVNSGLALK